MEKHSRVSLLRRFSAFATRSVAAARADLTLFDDVAEFHALGDEAGFALRINAVSLDGVRLAAVTSTGHRMRVRDDDNVTVLLPWSGSLATDDGRREQRASGDAFALPAPGRRSTRVPHGYVGLVAQLPLVRLRAAGAENPQDPFPARWPQPGQASLPSGGALARFLRHLAMELDMADALARSERGARGAADLLAALMLDHFNAAQQAAPTAATGLLHVRLAAEAIRARLHEPVSIQGLAGELGIGTRTLEIAFQQHRGMTPRAFLAACRLDAALERLARARPAERVTDIALDCGISHLGRFSAEYRRRFGEAPSETLARARQRG